MAGMGPIAHAGHWAVQLVYLAPLVAFVGWLLVLYWRERRRRGRPTEEKQE